MNEPKKEYEPPSIIYEGEITTRAGTPARNDPDPSGADPADLFGE